MKSVQEPKSLQASDLIGRRMLVTYKDLATDLDIKHELPIYEVEELSHSYVYLYFGHNKPEVTGCMTLAEAISRLTP